MPTTSSRISAMSRILRVRISVFGFRVEGFGIRDSGLRLEPQELVGNGFAMSCRHHRLSHWREYIHMAQGYLVHKQPPPT